ncbi:expansin-like A2 isoform X1 [Cucurbita moschata]|uniref:Expansin-like A2 isoform X1 n=1 Tax=Cucurbita moschata TaxID=3662 RepID=A0A6J1EKV9_CUCMO|nr:expansin-like A2 isoform X1 [Cucurbita moschata]
MGLFLCLLLFFLASSASACDRCLHHSKTAYISNDSTLSSGACGYGSLALGFLDGHLAAGVPSLYKEGVRCGACYQMRCKDKKLCSTSGTKLILTDLNLHTNRTDLVLSKKAFSALAQKGQHYNIFKRTTLDVEYKRIPCEYKKQNLSVRIEESSQKPHHMAVKFLYQGGQTDILLVHLRPVDWGSTFFMSRRHGTAVWEIDTAPEAAVVFQLRVISGFDGMWVTAERVVPADWKPGMIYDLGVQMDAIAKGQESCRKCDEGHW